MESLFVVGEVYGGFSHGERSESVKRHVKIKKPFSDARSSEPILPFLVHVPPTDERCKGYAQQQIYQ
jgi:hypothetical protein